MLARTLELLAAITGGCAIYIPPPCERQRPGVRESGHHARGFDEVPRRDQLRSSPQMEDEST
jgi:hypothetical protein